MDNSIEVLEEVLEVLEEEKRKLYDLVNQNDFRIEEINSYLQKLSGEEEDNFRIFSPRNAENMHREQIESDISEKETYEAENAEYQKKIEFLRVLSNKVNAVIENLQMKEKNKKQQIFINESEQEQQKDDLENKHIAHQILNCVSFITSDNERAKVELTAIAKKLNR